MLPSAPSTELLTSCWQATYLLASPLEMSLPPNPSDLLPAHAAAARNDVQELARLLREGATIKASDSGETPLHAAARTGATDTLKWLLGHNTCSPLDKAINGNTPTHYAAVYGHLGALKVRSDASNTSRICCCWMLLISASILVDTAEMEKCNSSTVQCDVSFLKYSIKFVILKCKSFLVNANPALLSIGHSICSVWNF